MGRLLVGGASLALALALSGRAQAEAGKRDGFYQSMHVGPGYLTANASGDPGRGYVESVSGFANSLGLWLGGTLGRVVVGGGFLTQAVIGPNVDFSGDAFTPLPWAAVLVSPGAFLDIYPKTGGKLHLMPFLGWAWFAPWASSFGPSGPAASLGVGYDFSEPRDSWRLGLMARFAYTPLFENDVVYHTFAPSLLFTATYH